MIDFSDATFLDEHCPHGNGLFFIVLGGNGAFTAGKVFSCCSWGGALVSAGGIG